jgi:hypothetical protein
MTYFKQIIHNTTVHIDEYMTIYKYRNMPCYLSEQWTRVLSINTTLYQDSMCDNTLIWKSEIQPVVLVNVLLITGTIENIWVLLWFCIIIYIYTLHFTIDMNSFNFNNSLYLRHCVVMICLNYIHFIL